ncbi:MAG: VWA domain-containing protein [Halobacteriota archaeon]
MMRYPAFSAPTEEEKGFPELPIWISLTSPHVEVHSSENLLAGLPSELQAQLRRALAQFERDFAMWVSLSNNQLRLLSPLKVTLAATAHALVDEADNVALASVDDNVVYLSYALLREGVPVGFRLGVFEYIFGCLTREGHDKNRDELLEGFSLPLLADQVNVLRTPERYAVFAEKDWFDALLVHLTKKNPRLGAKAVPHAASESAALSRSIASLQEGGVGLSEAQQRQIAELAARSKVDKALLFKKMSTLITIISTGLGEDVDIKVAPGEWWAYDYESNTITFPLIELITAPPDKIIGSLLHEIGHYQITRVDKKNPTFIRLLATESLRLLLNTFEDPRANNWMKATFKGTTPYFDLMYDDLLSEDLQATSYSYKLQKEVQKRSNSTIQAYQVFPHLEYLLSVLYFWRFGRLPSYLINPEVSAALEATVQFFESIFNHYPAGRASEQEKRLYAREAAEHIQKYILEPYEKLLKQAADNLALTIERGQQPLGEGENPSEINLQQVEQEAQQILEEHSKELADRLSAKRTSPESLDADALEKRIEENRDSIEHVRISPEKPHSELTRRDLIAQRRRLQFERSTDTDEYHRAYAAVSGLLQILVGTLENVLAKNRKPKYEGYYPSGQKPDLRRVMDVTRKIQQGLPTTKKDFDVFLKRRRPTHLDHRIMLLLDESGSMKEPKRTAALQGVLLFMEAFDYLGIDYAIIGFADAPIIHKPFGDNFTQHERERVFEDVSQFIPLGATADADALALGIDLFEREPEDVYRLIIVVSDGEGNVNTTGLTFKELQEVAATKSIQVVGIGIGEQAKTIRTRYDRPIQVATVDELPVTLGRVLEQGVTTDSSQ